MNKYFIIRVIELNWGLVERRRDLYEEAAEEYRKVKEEYSKIPCRVQLIKVVDGVESIIWNKELAKELNPTYHIEKAIEHLSSISSIETYSEQLLREQDENILNWRHGLQISSLLHATNSERILMLEKLENYEMARRRSKGMMDDCRYIKPHTEDALNRANKVKYALTKKHDRAKATNANARKNRNNDKYYDALGLNDAQINKIAPTKYHIARNTDIVLPEVDNKIILNEVINEVDFNNSINIYDEIDEAKMEVAACAPKVETNIDMQESLIEVSDEDLNKDKDELLEVVEDEYAEYLKRKEQEEEPSFTIGDILKQKLQNR